MYVLFINWLLFPVKLFPHPHSTSCTISNNTIFLYLNSLTLNRILYITLYVEKCSFIIVFNVLSVIYIFSIYVISSIISHKTCWFGLCELFLLNYFFYCFTVGTFLETGTTGIENKWDYMRWHRAFVHHPSLWVSLCRTCHRVIAQPPNCVSNKVIAYETNCLTCLRQLKDWWFDYKPTC